MNARGWSAYTSKGKTKADELATMMYEEAEKTSSDIKFAKTIRTEILIGKKTSTY